MSKKYATFNKHSARLRRPRGHKVCDC